MSRRSQSSNRGGNGFPVHDIRKLGKEIASAVAKRLALSHAHCKAYTNSRGYTLRIADEGAALYRDADQTVPVLLVREPVGESTGAFLEIAVDHQFETGLCLLTHVSLKLYTGASAGVSALRFRAEWDPRQQAAIHAQPHWNMDQVDAPDTPDPMQPSQAPWIPQVVAAPWTKGGSTEPSPTPRDVRSFHFAMAACWHSAPPHHSSPIETEAALVGWVAGCSGYIRDQLRSSRVS